MHQNKGASECQKEAWPRSRGRDDCIGSVRSLSPAALDRGPYGWLQSHAEASKGRLHTRLQRDGCACVEHGRGACAHHSGSVEMCRPKVATSCPFTLTTTEWLLPTGQTWRKPQGTKWGTCRTQAGPLLSNITALKSQQDLLVIFKFVCVRVCFEFKTIQPIYVKYMVSVNLC